MCFIGSLLLVLQGLMKNDLSTSKMLRKKVRVGQQFGLCRPKIEGVGHAWGPTSLCWMWSLFSFHHRLKMDVPFGRTFDGETGCTLKAIPLTYLQEEYISVCGKDIYALEHLGLKASFCTYENVQNSTIVTRVTSQSLTEWIEFWSFWERERASERKREKERASGKDHASLQCLEM